MAKQIRTTITATTRTGSDKDGNPRYTVQTTDGTWKTVAGVAVAYGIENSEFRGEVLLTIDDRFIVGASTINGSSLSGRQE